MKMYEYRTACMSASLSVRPSVCLFVRRLMEIGEGEHHNTESVQLGTRSMEADLSKEGKASYQTHG